MSKDRKEWSKEYYQKNKDRIKAQSIEYYKEHNTEEKRALKREYAKEYYSKNKDNITVRHKEYWKENGYKYRCRIRAKTPYNRAQILAASYNRSDISRGFDVSNNIDGKWIEEQVFASKCIYCGDDNWKHLGCDRIDNSKPHTPDNVVCSCGICNVERNDRYSVEEFIEYRKTHPRDKKFELPQHVIEINGKRVIRKVL